MKKLLLSAVALTAVSASFGQFAFDPKIEVTGNWESNTVVVPASPIQQQILFIGGHDLVQTVDANGQPNGTAVAKQWHDFIGFTEDSVSADLGWISVNHEMIYADDKIGDGGGMTVFKVTRDADNDTLIIVEQTLADGRNGKFFNVDFKYTVGETGMNCGGMVSADGRVWTAEEWYQGSNVGIYASGAGFRDTADVTVATDVPGFNGTSVKKYQTLNYMVEIDPTTAKAIRKQYNWGKFGFEGGAILPDNKTVILGVDATPAPLLKFVADNEGDFTTGTLYFYTQNGASKWQVLPNANFNDVFNMESYVWANGATMFNRVEWVALSQYNGNIYFTETGRDKPGSRWIGESLAGGQHANHHLYRALQQGTHPDSTDYVDYYGRVMQFNPTTNEVSVFIGGGDEFHGTADVPAAIYPENHLSNPDGLNFLHVNDREFMIICEDLNGRSFGRVPAGVNNSTCELYLLDMTISNPTVNDLVRIAVVPKGAEVTGATSTTDGKTILFNVQHPSTSNPFPFNNSLTVALTGWDKAVATGVLDQAAATKATFGFYPNPATREINFNEISDVAIYNAAGERVRVARNVYSVNISDLNPGIYFIRNANGATQKLIIE